MHRSSTFATGSGIGRRPFPKFCALTASLLAQPPGAAPILAEALGRARRLPAVWLSFQECTGCAESLTHSSTPTIERLLFELVSPDYHHTLQAASGAVAEQARETVPQEAAGPLLRPRVHQPHRRSRGVPRPGRAAHRPDANAASGEAPGADGDETGGERRGAGGTRQGWLRPSLRRLAAEAPIQAEIENPLAKEILSGRFGPKDTIRVEVDGGRFVFENVIEAEVV